MPRSRRSFDAGGSCERPSIRSSVPPNGPSWCTSACWHVDVLIARRVSDACELGFGDACTAQVAPFPRRTHESRKIRVTSLLERSAELYTVDVEHERVERCVGAAPQEHVLHIEVRMPRSRGGERVHETKCGVPGLLAELCVVRHQGRREVEAVGNLIVATSERHKPIAAR